MSDLVMVHVGQHKDKPVRITPRILCLFLIYVARHPIAAVSHLVFGGHLIRGAKLLNAGKYAEADVEIARFLRGARGDMGIKRWVQQWRAECRAKIERGAKGE